MIISFERLAQLLLLLSTQKTTPVSLAGQPVKLRTLFLRKSKTCKALGDRFFFFFLVFEQEHHYQKKALPLLSLLLILQALYQEICFAFPFTYNKEMDPCIMAESLVKM